MEAIHAPDKPENNKLRISVPQHELYLQCVFGVHSRNGQSRGYGDILLRDKRSRTIENVRENGYDFGIIRYNTAHEKYFTDYLSEKNLDGKLLWEFQMLAVMSSEHPAANLEELTYSALSTDYIELGQGDEAVPYVSGAPKSSTPRTVPPTFRAKSCSCTTAEVLLTFS